MDSKILKKCIDKNELQLNFLDKISHYSPVTFILVFPVCILYFKVKDFIIETERPIREGEIFLFIIPIIIFLLLFKLQKKRLRFKIVETNLNIEKIHKVIDETANELAWNIDQRNNSFLTAHTNPKFTSGSWGEQITVIFKENKILVNSICDLNKRSSLVSMGRNKKNEQILISNIKRASH